eukprot:1984445-Prymnesium_polylepis.2
MLRTGPCSATRTPRRRGRRARYKAGAGCLDEQRRLFLRRVERLRALRKEVHEARPNRLLPLLVLGPSSHAG